MLKYLIGIFIKSAAPLLVKAFIRTLQILATEPDNSIGDRIVYSIIDNKEQITFILIKFRKVYLK